MASANDLTIITQLTFASGAISLLCLLALHFTSPEFHPGWRMVSEYALGKYKWLLTCFFVSWCISTLSCALLVLLAGTSGWSALAAFLLFISGIGALMGGLFDVRHKLHGLSFLLGVPTFPAGALFCSYHLPWHSGWENLSTVIVLSAHSTWISLVVMAISMVTMINGFKKAGIAIGPNTDPPKKLPDGVIALNGYANRLLIVCYISWSILLALYFLFI